MHALRQAANPFGLLTNPQEVFRAVEASEKLQNLSRQICRPLDRMPGGRPGGENGVADAAPIDGEANESALEAEDLREAACDITAANAHGDRLLDA